MTVVILGEQGQLSGVHIAACAPGQLFIMNDLLGAVKVRARCVGHETVIWVHTLILQCLVCLHESMVPVHRRIVWLGRTIDRASSKMQSLPHSGATGVICGSIMAHSTCPPRS